MISVNRKRSERDSETDKPEDRKRYMDTQREAECIPGVGLVGIAADPVKFCAPIAQSR